MFRFLNQEQYDALDATAKAAYDKALTEFVTLFRKDYPNGLDASVRIRDLSIVPVPGKDGKEPVHTFAFATDNELINTNIPKGRMSRPVTNANIIATNAGFGSWSHMALMLKPLSDKGTFKFTIKVNVKGETYGTGLNKGVYKNTTMAQDNFEYVPSAAVAARYSKLTEAAATKGFEELLHAGSVTKSAAEPAAVPAEPDADI